MSTRASAGSVMTKAIAAANSTALAGTLRELSVDQRAEAGTAPSRLNA